MTKPTLNSSDSSLSPDSGATNSLWQPSWLHWLISALSGTVEIEKQTAWLKKHNEDLRKSNEELRKSNEDLRRENARLAELESKLDAVLPKYNFSLTPPSQTDEP
jgi:FtsZ-binding cell division protein ZapB